MCVSSQAACWSWTVVTLIQWFSQILVQIFGETSLLLQGRSLIYQHMQHFVTKSMWTSKELQLNVIFLFERLISGLWELITCILFHEIFSRAELQHELKLHSHDSADILNCHEGADLTEMWTRCIEDLMWTYCSLMMVYKIWKLSTFTKTLDSRCVKYPVALRFSCNKMLLPKTVWEDVKMMC